MSNKGTSKSYTSAGIHSNVRKNVLNANRSAYLRSGTRVLNQRLAFNAGKNVVLTIENPNKEETNKRYIRVNASTVWRNPKDFNKS